MSPHLVDGTRSQWWSEETSRSSPDIQGSLSKKSTEELEMALLAELHRLEQSGLLPETLSEKLSSFDILQRQARTGMRFGMVIDRDELPALQIELNRARTALIDLCLTDLVKNLQAVA